MTPQQIDLFTPRLLQVQHDSEIVNTVQDEINMSRLAPRPSLGRFGKHVRLGTEMFVGTQQHVWRWSESQMRGQWHSRPHIQT